MLSLAAEIAASDAEEGVLRVVHPTLSAVTVEREWDALLPLIVSQLRARMRLVVETALPRQEALASRAGLLSLDKPNYRFEVLRLLLGAALEDDGPQPEAGITARIGTQADLGEALGASSTPVRSALTALRDAGLIPSLTWLEIAPEDVSMDLLSRIGALPQVLRFRFERGARIKPPAELMERAKALLGPKGPEGWRKFSLSGTPVAHTRVPALDLFGAPRLDLLAHVPRTERHLDGDVMRLLDDGLEPEPNPLAPAPVVLTLVRGATVFNRDAGPGAVRCAHPCDVFLSLLDMGLRDQALQYARAVRP